MVTFVPNFVSAKRIEWLKLQTAAFDSIKKISGLDSAARVAADTAWVRAHQAPKAYLTDVADHIDHVKRIAGADFVGIGSDFDGIDEVVVGLEDVSKYPALFAELAKRGWSDADLKKLAGENILRALGEAEKVAGRLKEERGK
jgi:membrane dipeptidase